MSNSKAKLKLLQQWINNVSVYPPSEIYFNAPKKMEKQERQVKKICERLYRFNWEGAEHPNPIGNVRSIIRDMEVLSIMFDGCHVRPKYENIVEIVIRFVYSVIPLTEELKMMHESHNALSNWYDEWSLMPIHLVTQSYGWSQEILGLSDVDFEDQFLFDVYNVEVKS